MSLPPPAPESPGLPSAPSRARQAAWAVIATATGWLALSMVVHSGLLPGWLESERPIGILASRAALWAVSGASLAAFAHGLLVLGERRLHGVAEAIGAVLVWLLAGVLFAAAVDVGADLIDSAFGWVSPRRGGSRSSGRSFTNFTWIRSLTPILAMSAWGAIVHLLRTQRRLHASRDRALRAEALAVEARLEMLRHELNPHFLFNALNALIGVIAEDPRRAQTMVRHLAGLLRSILTGPAVATLSDERDLVERYLAIERERFEDRLQASVHIPAALEAFRVPALLLQPLVENAVKHGRVDDIIRVSVSARPEGEHGVCVEVRNRGSISSDSGSTPSLGVGLRNLRDRLEHLGPGARLDLIQDGDEVVVRVHLPTEAAT